MCSARWHFNVKGNIMEMRDFSGDNKYSHFLAFCLAALFSLNVFAINLSAGWNLVGNSWNTTISVANKFSDQTAFASVWKWNEVSGNWSFFAPNLSPVELSNYANSRGYLVLNDIFPGEGYWVNAKKGIVIGDENALPLRIGGKFFRSGWNLVSTAVDVSPYEFDRSLSETNFSMNYSSLWAWDSVNGKWSFTLLR